MDVRRECSSGSALWSKRSSGEAGDETIAERKVRGADSGEAYSTASFFDSARLAALRGGFASRLAILLAVMVGWWWVGRVVGWWWGIVR